MAGLGHSDAPVATTEGDFLGLAPYASALADFIARCDTPMTVAIQGDWGTGKTSLMNMVKDVLRSGPSAPATDTIWFATWQYAQFGATDTLAVSLLSTLLRKIGGDEQSLLKSGMNVLKKLAKPAVNIALGAATGGAVQLPAADGGAEAVDLACNAEELKTEIEKLVLAKRNKGIQRIVVFVDDLDRVPPARAVEILETIKLFMDLEGCVFVLALDYAVVRRGLKEKFGVAENDLGGRSFFDKIIQLPFAIPTARYETDRFINNLFGQMGLKMSADDDDLFASLARASVSANPRGIKRVFNSLQLLIGMARAQGVLTGNESSDRLMVRNIFALLCMQNRFEPVHDWLVFNANQLDAKTLNALGGGVEGDQQPIGSLTAAIKTLDDEQNRQFGQFARAFVTAIQDPADSSDEIDESELARFRDALTLTRVTSVNEEAGPTLLNDPEFRWANRDMMKRLKTEFARGVEDLNSIAVTQPHGESGVSLYRGVDRAGWFSLTLYHGEARAALYIEAGPRRLNGKKEVLKVALKDITPLFDDSVSGVVTLWHQQFDGSREIRQREAVLRESAQPLFFAVQEAVTGLLE